jgi:hypothetical protein
LQALDGATLIGYFSRIPVNIKPCKETEGKEYVPKSVTSINEETPEDKNK